ncbi:hypothetical protein, conserved [Plasmodium gonderi]|uniref:Uncharacterized protein n=1 Tax=Plasmodium gonderi TaxID=77519 RepID=A0A1Y1JMH1_PLAGO|nr:hypothetical protein, conserved [Plasmodium gonderi]GAW82655.1 hypothetical protein, conserved [Plasmodium gonderi]
MFNVFSAAFLDNNSNNFNSINKPINNNINKSTNLARSISTNVNNENDRSKNLPLKDRLATVRNAQNILNKKNLNKTDETNNSGNNNDGLNTNNSGNNNEEKNVASNSNANLNENEENDVNKAGCSTIENNLGKFKNYSSVVNEKKNEELEKKLKKRKRRRKHVILMERMKQKEKEKRRQREMEYHQNNDEDDEGHGEEGENEERNNYKVVGRRGRPSKHSKNKMKEKLHQEEEDEKEGYNDDADEDDDEEGKYNNKSKDAETNFSNKFYNSGTNERGTTNMHTLSFRKNMNNNSNTNRIDNNDAGLKPKRKRRKKKEMEEYRARLLKEKMQQQNSLSSVLTKTNSFNNNGKFNNNNNESNTQGEVKVKRKRGRPKASEVAAMKSSNDKLKQNDIRKYCSKNSDNQSMKRGGMQGQNKGEGGGNNEEENKNVFKIIKTTMQENTAFVKKSPTEIIELEKIYKNNIKKGVTCIPLNYQSKGGGMAIILIGAGITYGPVKNSYGFMTFLVLDCHSNNLFIDTGIKNNVIECEKHMQLLISPGDMYMFKNQSQEVEARLLLIVCNKMNQPFDAKMHIKDPEINTHK